MDGCQQGSKPMLILYTPSRFSTGSVRLDWGQSGWPVSPVRFAAELSMGRMDPRVRSRFCRILAGRVSTFFSFVYWFSKKAWRHLPSDRDVLGLGPTSDNNFQPITNCLLSLARQRDSGRINLAWIRLETRDLLSSRIFLGSWIDMNLWILHSDWLFFYDI